MTAMRQWIGPSLLSSVLVLGCNHVQPHPGTTTSLAAAAPRQAPVVVASLRDQAADLSQMKAPTPMPQTSHPIDAPEPVASTFVPPPPPAPHESTAGDPAARIAVLPVSAGKEQNAHVFQTPDAESMAGSHYGHAPDYTWFTGELEQIHPREIWQLRYAPVGEEERYGGSITLIGVGRMMGSYQSGQWVRVEGRLLDPESREVSPGVSVSRIDPLH